MVKSVGNVLNDIGLKPTDTDIYSNEHHQKNVPDDTEHSRTGFGLLACRFQAKTQEPEATVQEVSCRALVKNCNHFAII